ncbi:MAG: xanthine dehydrogenase family protein molybdopterin-binding subunit [Geminicoccaceae bacterium]
MTRVEDQRLITGMGRYTDDVTFDNQVHAVFLRSPHAHAEILSVDTTSAKGMPGVLAILTGDDVAADGLGDMPCQTLLENKDGSKMTPTPRPILARGRVRYVGDPVALVVAETFHAARDAAEAIEVDYKELPAHTDLATALDAGAAQIWDHYPNNQAFDWDKGNGAKVDELIEGAAKVSSVQFVNNRVIPNPMEPRSAIGVHQADEDKYELYTGGQSTHMIRDVIAGELLKIEPSSLRVVTGDVGGGFGMKISAFPEQAAVLWAAKKVGRPVRWASDRSEGMLSDTHGRDHVTKVTIAMDENGKMLALKATAIANLGGYLAQLGPFIPTDCGAAMYAGVYDFQATHFEVKGAFTNTVPLDPYRGAGRPEAMYAVERAVDHAARDIGMDPAEFRRLNFLKPEQMPHKTDFGVSYDSGEFEALMDQAIERADVKGFAARKEESVRRGNYRGLGMIFYIEQCGGGPPETARVALDADCKVQILIGNQSNGQGHETLYTQFVSDNLGIDSEQIRVFQGDTETVPLWGLTGGSRATSIGGSAVRQSNMKIIEQAKEIAADMLEASAADVAFEDGTLKIVGTDRSVTLSEVAAKAGGLGAEVTVTDLPPPFPNGCHICELEIDGGTGTVSIERYTVVDDFGAVINPMLIEGQIHGGVAQGLGQALMENAVYDKNSGQLLSGSFMDYAMPRADYMPKLDFTMRNVPCTTNELGVKGCGEAGAIGAPAALINGIVDALSPLGVTHIDMPATTDRIWAAMKGAESRIAAE